MLLRQPLQARTDAMKVLNLVQDRFKRHRDTALRKKPKVWEYFRLDWLRSEDLQRGEGGNHLKLKRITPRRDMLVPNRTCRGFDMSLLSSPECNY